MVGVAATMTTPVTRPALLTSKASNALLTDVAAAGNRLVSVGEHGLILVSEDGGNVWKQVASPTSVMLTSVFFVDGKNGWATGHEGVILATKDGGNSWKMQYSNAPDSKHQGSPLLGVWFHDAQYGIAVGAYGYFLKTTDGGNTWVEDATTLANPDGWHLNAIRGSRVHPEEVFVVGEKGMIFRSNDGGHSFAKLAAPFEGSFFGVAQPDAGLLMVFGLGGKLYRSADDGNAWQAVESSVTSGLNSAVKLSDGRVFVVGNRGTVLVSYDNGLSFTASAREDRQGLTAIVGNDKGQPIAVGEGGPKLLKMQGGK